MVAIHSARVSSCPLYVDLVQCVAALFRVQSACVLSPCCLRLFPDPGRGMDEFPARAVGRRLSGRSTSALVRPPDSTIEDGTYDAAVQLIDAQL